jgi:hypothetical protein
MRSNLGELGTNKTTNPFMTHLHTYTRSSNLMHQFKCMHRILSHASQVLAKLTLVTAQWHTSAFYYYYYYY